MTRQKEMLAHILDAFPPRTFRGEVIAGDGPEYSEIRETLDDATWWSVPGDFVQKYAEYLPQLTKDAYMAFLPLWLREAVLDPTGKIAQLVIANLKEGSMAPHYSRQQSYGIIQIATWIVEQNGAGPKDPANVASVARIKQMWEE